MADIFDLFKQIAKKDSGPTTAPTHMIVGLGNPGAEYAGTRHNAGYIALDALAAKLHIDVTRAKFNALCGDGMLGDYRVLLIKPLTFMNASGEAVQAAADFYKIPKENILVLVDDINLAAGRMRVRAGGSDGGQRGLRSIITQMGSDAFPRIRFGVGQKPNPEYDLRDWVLGKFPKEDLTALETCFALTEEAAKKIFAGKVDEAMGLCNGHRPDKENG